MSPIEFENECLLMVQNLILLFLSFFPNTSFDRESRLGDSSVQLSARKDRNSRKREWPHDSKP